MGSPYKIIIQDAWQYDSYDIFVVEELWHERHVLSPGGKERIRLEEEPAEQDIEPTLRIRREVAHALVEALSEMGIRTNKDAKIEGTLEATRYHLEDMRALAGVKTPPGRLVSKEE